MKKVFAMLLSVALLLSLLGGCGAAPASAPEAAPAPEASAEVPEVQAPAEEVPEAQEAPEAEETSQVEEASVIEEAPAEAGIPDKIIPQPNTYALPLCDEMQTFTFFWTYPPFLAEQIDDLTDGYAKQELEDITGVHIEFDAVAAPVASESFQLMVAADSYTDIIQDIVNYYAAGMDRAIEDEVVMDLTDLIENNMANYSSMINANPEIRKQLTSSDGYIGAIMRLYSEPSVPKTGTVIRKDWLDDLGMELPHTVDEYHEILTAFHEDKGAASPYYIMGTGVAFANTIIGAYGVQADFYQEDGTIKYGFIEDGFKDYLTEMNTWYREGLISPDYVSNTWGYPDNGNVTAGEVGVFSQENTYMQDIYSFTDDTSIVLSAAPNAVLKEGDVNKFITFGDWIGGISWSISTDCENVELLGNFIDYLFTEEGSRLANYGVQGLSWDYDAEGKPVINEAITDNPDYNASMAQLKYTLLWAPFVEDYDRFNVGYTEAEIAAADIWRENSSNEALLPNGLSVSADYISAYNDVFSDIDTFVTENTNKFITGNRSLDEFDDFVEEVKAMNIDYCIDIWQEMLDAYNAR